MSSHNFHWQGGSELKTHWSDAGQCIMFTVGGSDICIHAHGHEHIERLHRAYEAFAAEMQRDPVARQQAAE
jgi:hypothetical protein